MVVCPGQACHPHMCGKFTFHSRCGRFRVSMFGGSRPVVCTHLPAVCPQCAMGQHLYVWCFIVPQNIRRAVLTEAVRVGAMVMSEFASHGHGAVVADCGLFVVCSSVLAIFFSMCFLRSYCMLPLLWTVRICCGMCVTQFLCMHLVVVSERESHHGTWNWPMDTTRRMCVVSYVSAASAQRNVIQVRHHLFHCRSVSCDTFVCDRCCVVRARVCGWIVGRSVS